jgi:hypothetical protein
MEREHKTASKLPVSKGTAHVGAQNIRHPMQTNIQLEFTLQIITFLCESNNVLVCVT